MYKLIAVALLSILLASANFAFAKNQLKDPDYGLYFQAYPSRDSQKTSLVLERGQALDLGDELSLSFDVFVRPDNVFGMVSRIITDKKENIDLMFTVGDDGQRYPILTINEKVYVIRQAITEQKWIPVRLILSKAKKQVTLIYGGVPNTVSYPLNASSATFSFGVCPVPGYRISDIASVNVKNVKVLRDNQLIRYWKLKKYHQNQTLDEIEQIPALATNPKWIINEYSSWKKIYTAEVANNSQFVFDGNQTFYVVSPDSKPIIAFDVKDKTQKTLPVKGGFQVGNITNASFYDPKLKRIVSYNPDENKVSTFSFENSSWSATEKVQKDPRYMNNTAVFDAAESVIYSFGGYGFYKYNRDLVKIDLKDGAVKKTQIAEILPRYSASSVLVDGKLYVFGGRGSKSGRQELSPRNFYDLYAIDLILGQATLLWETDKVKTDFLPGENMVYDRDKDCFYVLGNIDGGTLLKISRDHKGIEEFSFPIKETQEANFLYTSLYYSATLKKLYALIYRKLGNSEAHVSVYELNAPPAAINNLGQAPVVSKSNLKKRLLLTFIGSAIVFVGLFLLYRFRKKQIRVSGVKVMSPEEIRASEGAAIVSAPAFEEQKESNEHTLSKRLLNEPLSKEQFSKERLSQEQFSNEQLSKEHSFSKNSIAVIGGFKVKDASGNDITSQFSPTLRSLLIMLILFMDKKEQGVSGHKIWQLLWYDKNETAAKKNRNVYFSKLRTAFEALGGVDIANQNGFWTINFNEDIVCDYQEAMKIFAAIKENKTTSIGEVHQLLALLGKGPLLPNVEVDWLDSFKSDFSNLTVDVLSDIWKNKDHDQLDHETLLRIADTLFLHDSIHEEALYLKCTLLFNQGKKGLAKNIYDNFCKEYTALLGMEYKYTLVEIIAGKNLEN